MEDPDLNPPAGNLLLAKPMLQDPNFFRTVILLCENSQEATFGLVINKPMPVKLNELAPNFDYLNHIAHTGGPVQPDTLHVLHQYDDDRLGSKKIADGVFWGGDYELMQSLWETDPSSQQYFRFYLGYSGWGEEQLSSELERQDWIVAPAISDDIFVTPAKKVWGSILKRMGGEYQLIANFPENPSMN